MKKIFSTRYLLTIAIIALVIAGCKKTYLDEYNPSNRTTDSYYTTVKGYEALVTSCYPLLRNIVQERIPTLN